MILGYKTKYLDSVECYLTYRGARRLAACPPGLKEWRNKFLAKKLSSREVIEKFQEYSPECFLASIICKKFVNSSGIEELYNLDCIISPTTERNILYMERVLKAIIIELSTRGTKK